jgi:ligand-binding sensor protein/anti-sigma regulatory factor (Ser/Thr protein kinase)
LGAQGHELASLIDLDRVQRLCDSFSQAFDVTLAVLDLSGRVLVATGWQDICTRYHRVHPDTLQGCLESDLSINRRLLEGMGGSEHYAYRCRNGLWDVAFPLIVDGEHLANVYTGQFFFEDDDVDRESFVERARRLGFDEDAYLEALDRVPIISHDRLHRTIAFLSDFVGMLGELGLSALRHEQQRAELEESERRYRRLFDNATEGLIVFRAEEDATRLTDLVVVDLNPIHSQRTRTTREQLVGRRLSAVDGSDERLRAYFEVVTGAVATGRPARCEIYLRGQAAYELLSVYPIGRETWVLSATDVTELRQAERALRRQEESIRNAYVDVLDAVTGGKLILLTDEQLADELGTPLGHQIVFGAASELATARRRLVRAAESCFPGRIRHTELLSTVGEALDNALKHAGGGAYQAFARDDCLQVAVSDDGPGIDFRMLPRATLVPGFSTAASLGMGFTIMLQLCERVLLTTRPGHTVVVLEFAPALEPQLEGAGGGSGEARGEGRRGPR